MFFRKKPQSTKFSRKAARNAIKYPNKVTQKYTKKYTTKEFKKFSPDVQQILTNRYNVILTDYKTKKEKLAVLKPTKKNVSRGIVKFNKGLKTFDRGMMDLEMGFKEIDRTFTSKKSKSKYNLDNLAGF